MHDYGDKKPRMKSEVFEEIRKKHSAVIGDMKQAAFQQEMNRVRSEGRARQIMCEVNGL